jgi:DNA-binding transcriptional LysR family regulator
MVDKRMQLEDLQIYVAAVDERSFTAAALRLQLSKQFISRRVMGLESDLGVRLLVRNTRKLAVTDLGQEFYERAKRILAEVADAEQAMSSQRSNPRGLLRVSAPMSFGATHLSPLVADFMRTNPDVRVDVELSDRVVDIIGESFDVALRIGQEGRTGWEFLVDGTSRAFEVRGPLRANNGEVIREAAVAGLGIALLPEFIVASALKSGALLEVLNDFDSPPLALYAVYPQHRESAVTVRAFAHFLRQRFNRALLG